MAVSSMVIRESTQFFVIVHPTPSICQTIRQRAHLGREEKGSRNHIRPKCRSFRLLQSQRPHRSLRQPHQTTPARAHPIARFLPQFLTMMKSRNLCRQLSLTQMAEGSSRNLLCRVVPLSTRVNLCWISRMSCTYEPLK